MRRASVILSTFTLVALCSPVYATNLFNAYTLDSQFTLPAGSGTYDVMPDGRIVALSDAAEVLVETAVGSRVFASAGTLPGATISTFGPSFIRVSPDGSSLAVGDGNFGGGRVGVFNATTLAGTWFNAEHASAEWYDNDRVAIASGAFGQPSIVSVLESSSPDPANPINTTVIANIGGASGGITFDAAGRLYTANGFSTGGPSGTGAVKAFDPALWTPALSGGAAVDFEAAGTLVIDVLSGTSLGFDSEGNFHVGGGDFFGGTDLDFAALAEASAVQNALAGGGPVNSGDPAQTRRLDPDTLNLANFYGVNSNAVTDELYISSGGTVYVYTPEPASLVLLGAVAALAVRRR